MCSGKEEADDAARNKKATEIVVSSSLFSCITTRRSLIDYEGEHYMHITRPYINIIFI